MTDTAQLVAQARAVAAERKPNAHLVYVAPELMEALADALEAETSDTESRRRAMAKVEDGENGCWIWTGAKTGNGYASIWNPRTQKSEQAHRLFYEWYVGPIPDHLQACHLCDVPLCVNPKHIFLGTQADNMQDCARKQRFAVQRGMAQKGEEHGSAKLTEADVRRIRGFLADGLSTRAIAAEFGVHQATIYRIANGINWSHVS